jgi:hypothetical protein
VFEELRSGTRMADDHPHGDEVRSAATL